MIDTIENLENAVDAQLAEMLDEIEAITLNRATEAFFEVWERV